MDLIKVTVIEDDITAADMLCGLLGDYGRQKTVKFDITRFSNAEDFLEGYAPRFDIVFMDIDLPGMNGMKAAEKLRELDKDVLLVFVTNMKQYVFRGYEVGALNYILKPIKYTSLSMTLDRALRTLGGKSNGSILVKTEKGTERIPCEEIYYIDVRGHNVVLHTTSANIQIYGSLINFAPALQERGFIRCSSSAMVNPRFVKMFDNSDITMTNGDIIALSRSQRNTFKKEITAYFGEIL